MSYPWLKFFLCCGRLLAFGFVCLFVTFFVAEGGVNPATLKPVELQMMSALAICLAGYTLQAAPPYNGIRRPVWGAAIGLVGMSTFYFVNYLQSGRIPGGPVFPFMFLPGLIEILVVVWPGGEGTTRSEGSKAS